MSIRDAAILSNLLNDTTNLIDTNIFSVNDYINEQVIISEYNFNNNELIIQKMSDKIIPDFLVLRMNDEQSYENIINNNILQYVNLNLFIGNNIIYSVPLSFLCAMNPPLIRNNKLHIKLNFHYFIEFIPLCKLEYSEIIFKIHGSNRLINFVDNYSLISKCYHYIDTNIGSIMTQITNTFIKCLNSIYVNIPHHEFVFTLNISNFKGFSKGLFIEGKIDHLTEICLKINNFSRIHYNKFLIEQYCTKISNKLLYLPFSPNNISYKSNVFDGSINLTRADYITLKLTFNTPQNNIGVHNLFVTKLDYRNGYMHLLTNNFNCIEPLMLNYHNNGYQLFHTNNTNPNNNNTINNYNQNNSDLNNSIIVINEIQNKFINPEIEDNICQINIEPINEKTRYMECNLCHKKFKDHSLIFWLNHNEIKSCPICRTTWNNYIIYINQN
jgi:hypothetical protein